MQESIKGRIDDIFYPEDPQEPISHYFNLGMLILISLNVIAVIFETEIDLYLKYKGFFDTF